jgi:uncharacterized protein with beta-barrel porin domain
VSGSYRGHYNADTLAGRVEADWRLQSSRAGLTPYIVWRATSDSVPSYDEKTISGAGTFALSYRGEDFDSSRNELGVRPDRSLDMENGAGVQRGPKTFRSITPSVLPSRRSRFKAPPRA